MEIVCLDLEGVLVPEIWIHVAEKTGVDELTLTTRDSDDYDFLMNHRLKLLQKHAISLKFIQSVIAEIAPLEGALSFMNWLQVHFQVAIVSDTFYELAMPLMKLFGYPMLLCHHLDISQDNGIIGYQLRQNNAKEEVVKSFQSLGFSVYTVGDSYNDLGMLLRADEGFLFRAPEIIIQNYPQLQPIESYSELQGCFMKLRGAIDSSN